MLRLALAGVLLATTIGFTPTALAAEATGPVAEQRTANAEEGGHSDAGSVAGPAAPVDRLVWMTVGILASGVVISVFYALKRRVGGFPANPSWVAPITIVPSSTFPDESTFGDAAHDSHGGGHGHH